MFDVKRLLKVNKITLGIILLSILLLLMPFAYSKLFSSNESETKLETAFFLLKADYYSNEIKLEELEPSDTPYIYKFKVANNDGKNRLETKMEYNLKVVTTTNLPLTYKIYKNASTENIITSDTIEQDEDGTYFRTLEISPETFGYEKDEENIYELSVLFPKEYDNFEYQDIVEGIFINIDAKQIISEN